MASSTHIGPVQVSDNGRYFIDQDGKPFFWLGDTQWELSRSFTLDHIRTILENRKSKGFSVIQAMITGFDDGSGANLAGQTPWINNDPCTPNEEYFKYVDSVMDIEHTHIWLEVIIAIVTTIVTAIVRSQHGRMRWTLLALPKWAFLRKYSWRKKTGGISFLTNQYLPTAGTAIIH